jgi:hypothetical protein
MPPRFTYWTIIIDGQPSAFRATEREELLPTLKQLQAKNPSAVMKWFARGRVWETPDEARQGRAKEESAVRDAVLEERRGRGWRPGGEHKDPREKFKKETFQAHKRREKKAANMARAVGHGGPASPEGGAPGQDAAREADRGAPVHGGQAPRVDPESRAPRGDRPPASGERGGPGGQRPWGGKPSYPRNDRGPASGEGRGPGRDRPQAGDRPPTRDHHVAPPAPPEPTRPPSIPDARAPEPIQSRPETPARATPPTESGPPAPAHKTRHPHLRKPR